jgi:hypothetical protein
MTNIDVPRVFIADYSQPLMAQMFYIDGGVAAAIGLGSLVKKMTDGGTGLYPGADVMAAASDDYTGIVLACFYTDFTPRLYIPASTAGYVLVATNPELRLIMQQDDADTANFTINDSGDCCDVTFGAVSTSLGYQPIQLSPDTLAGDGASAQFRLIAPVRDANNEIGDWCKWIVVAHEHALATSPAAL